MSYTVNKGSQQVTIYPYQELTSYYGNQMLYGLIPSGIFAGKLSVHDGGSVPGYTTSDVVFKISQGSVFTFLRSYTTVSEGTKHFIGKVVLDSDALINIPKITLWKSPVFIAPEVTSIVITADWSYNLQNPVEKYVEFEIITNVEMPQYVSQGKLIIGEFLNHRYFVQNTGSTPPFPEVSVTSYQVQYPVIPSQPRELFQRLSFLNRYMPISFAADGHTIKVGPGTVWVSDTLIHVPQTESPPIPGQTNIPPGHTASEYYQIDVLRWRANEEPAYVSTQTIELVWDSFLKPKPTPGWDFSDISNIPQSQILQYLNGYEFSIYDQSLILLIGVRDCATIPSNPQNTVLWPGQCMIFDYTLPQIGSPEYHSRMKLPIHDHV